MQESDINPLHGSHSRSAARREIEKIFPVETTVAVIKPETAEESGGKGIVPIKTPRFRASHTIQQNVEEVFGIFEYKFYTFLDLTLS